MYRFCSIGMSFLPGAITSMKGETAMATGTESVTYRSPLRKLVQFFERSRDGWKEKYQNLKQRCKQLINQVRAVEKSREHWREMVEDQRRQLKALEEELAAIKNSIAAADASRPRGP
jgi:peptidoglycan hydrolase CwlO-like protein